MEGLFFIPSKYRVTKGFKFHARPQTGAYSCYYLCLEIATCRRPQIFHHSDILLICLSASMFSPDLDKMMPHIPPSYEDKQRLMKANGGRYQISAVTKCGNEVQEGR